MHPRYVQQPCKLFGDTKVTPTYFIVIPGHQQTKQLSRHSIDVNDRNGWEGKERLSHPTWQNKAEGSELGGNLKIFRRTIFSISVYDERMEVCHFRLLNASSLVLKY